MLHLQRIHTHHPHYPFVEALLHSAFPEAERRDDLEQREQTDHHPLFHCYLVTDTDGKTEEQPVGLITVWRLEGFSYVEHLATSATVRNQGYGRRILEALRKEVQGLLILEVEPPTHRVLPPLRLLALRASLSPTPLPERRPSFPASADVRRSRQYRCFLRTHPPEYLPHRLSGSRCPIIPKTSLHP